MTHTRNSYFWFSCSGFFPNYVVVKSVLQLQNRLPRAPFVSCRMTSQKHIFFQSIWGLWDNFLKWRNCQFFQFTFDSLKSIEIIKPILVSIEIKEGWWRHSKDGVINSPPSVRPRCRHGKIEQDLGWRQFDLSAAVSQQWIVQTSV